MRRRDLTPGPVFSTDDGAGADTQTWRRHVASMSLPDLDRRPASRLLVVSAHPDDEVLGAGALMASTVGDGGSVTVVCLSDGAASHPGSPTLRPDQIATTRRAELLSALAELGVQDVRHHRMPDGDLAGHYRDAVDAVDAAVLDARADRIAVVWRGDRHPDHEAAGAAAARVAQKHGIELLEYPIWMWHWAAPDDPVVPWGRACALRSNTDVVSAKQRAVNRFVSQIKPLSAHPADAAVLAPDTIARLVTDTEVYFR